MRPDRDLRVEGRTGVHASTGNEWLLVGGRPRLQFTYAEIGLGTTSVTGEMEMAFEDSWAHYGIHHFDENGLVRA